MFLVRIDYQYVYIIHTYVNDDHDDHDDHDDDDDDDDDDV